MSDVAKKALDAVPTQVRHTQHPAASSVLARITRPADIGEYRIIYRFDEGTFSIPAIGKRNDGEVYRLLRRLS
jgi:hypothetical protein